MANIKISEFQPATEVKDSDSIPIVQDGVNKKVASPILESKIINKTTERLLTQGGISMNLINPIDTVPTYASLSSITPTPNINDAYQVEEDGLIYVYTSSGFQDNGDGFQIQPNVNGKIAEGDDRAVSGGEVYESVKPLDLLVLRAGTNIADYLGVLNRDSINITKDLLLTKSGTTATATDYNTTSILDIPQDYGLNIHIYGANASICFYNSNGVFLEGYNKTDLGNMGLLNGNYLKANISQITTNQNVNKFIFCFFASNNTIINEVNLTQDELKNNTLSILDFNSEESINSKSVKNIYDEVNEIQDIQIDLINEISELKLELEIERESKQALFIEQASMIASSECPTNPKTLIIPTSITSNVINGDFSSWGASKIIMIAVKYSDGTHGNQLVTQYNSSSCTLLDTPLKTIVEIQSMPDELLGQHLTELGYKALAERLFNYDKRTSFRYKLIKSVAFNDHERDNVLINGYYGIKNKTTNERVLEYKLLNNYSNAWVTIAPVSQIYFINNSPRLALYQSSVLGAGISIKYTSVNKGYAELYLGTDLTHAGTGLLEVKKDGLSVFTKVFKGAFKRIIVDLEKGNYEFEFKVNENINVNMNLSSINFFEKRDISEGIFNRNDKILFITDSWGEYPVTTIESEKGVQFDGLKARNGKCTMPEHFRSLFVASGGKPENVQYCTRGGFTSEWGLYWLSHLINTVNPTKIVFHFGINDRNSSANYPSTSSAYDYDKDNIFLAKLYSNGGGFGSVNKDKFKENILEMKRICVSRGVTPIFFMMPIVAVASQSAGLMEWNRDIFLKGLN